MLKYFLKRLLTFIPLLIGITLLSFTIMHLAPGDPTSIMMDPKIKAADMLTFKKNLGLDKPIYIQYLHWLTQLLKGNFGYSFLNGKPVLTIIGERLPATLILSISSLVLILLITFPLGIISGAKAGSRFDNLVTVLTFLGLSIPSFWLGLILILTFSLKLNIFPTSGYLDTSLINANIFVQVLNIFLHMTLPLITIVIGGLASLTQYHRFGIIKILRQDYIRAARARGLSESTILFKHAFKNALLPIITILGLSLPGLIGGSFVIEYIFAWPGMGQLGVNAVFSRDYPVLMGTLFFSTILIIIGNFAADIAYTYADPRINKPK